MSFDFARISALIRRGEAAVARQRGLCSKVVEDRGGGVMLAMAVQEVLC